MCAYPPHPNYSSPRGFSVRHLQRGRRSEWVGWGTDVAIWPQCFWGLASVLTGQGKGCLVDKREADHDSREEGFSPDGAEDLRTKHPPPALVPTRPWEGCVSPGLSMQIEATPRPQPHLAHISRKLEVTVMMKSPTAWYLMWTMSQLLGHQTPSCCIPDYNWAGWGGEGRGERVSKAQPSTSERMTAGQQSPPHVPCG